MARRAVWGEPVSGMETLISWEVTGIFAGLVRRGSPAPGGAGLQPLKLSFPTERNRDSSP